MKQTLEKIEAIRDYGYELDFTNTFTHAFDVYKKTVFQVGLLYLALSFFVCTFFVVLLGAIFGFSALAGELTGYRISDLSPVLIVAYVIGMMIFSGLIAPLNAGVFKMAFLADKNEDFSMSNAFDCYNAAYFKPLFLSGAFLSFLGLVISVGFEMTDLSALGTILTLVISLLTFLTAPLIIFGNLNAAEAIRGSLIVVSKNILVILGLVIVAVLFAIVGIFGFCIGLFFTLPLVNAMYYSIYVSAIGIESEMNPEEDMPFRY